MARRLLWERQPHYSLNISVTDGVHLVTTVVSPPFYIFCKRGLNARDLTECEHSQVNITVINDANEDGVRFSRALYAVEALESTRVGEALAAPQAKGAGRLLYGLHAARAPASARLFRLHELTGVLELAMPLDRYCAAKNNIRRCTGGKLRRRRTVQGERGAARADAVGARPGAASVQGVRARGRARARRRRARARVGAAPARGAPAAHRPARGAGGRAQGRRPRRRRRRQDHLLAHRRRRGGTLSNWYVPICRHETFYVLKGYSYPSSIILIYGCR